MINTKLILTIKPTLATNTNNLMFNVILQKPLTNFSYYFNLVNLVKNFQVNDEIRTLDINFIDDNDAVAVANMAQGTQAHERLQNLIKTMPEWRAEEEVLFVSKLPQPPQIQSSCLAVVLML